LNKILHALAAVTLAAAVPASPALAQDGSEEAAARTPEAAQAFLSTFMQQGGWDVMTSSFFDGSTYRYYDGSAWHEVQERPKDGFSPADKIVHADILGWNAGNRCRSQLAVQTRSLVGPSFQPAQALSSPDLPVRIDWNTVQPIKVQEDRYVGIDGNSFATGRYIIEVQSPKTHVRTDFVTTSRTVADRASFAMSFLQQQCDPTAGSAF
jgi:hypothetical protein